MNLVIGASVAVLGVFCFAVACLLSEKHSSILSPPFGALEELRELRIELWGMFGIGCMVVSTRIIGWWS